MTAKEGTTAKASPVRFGPGWLVAAAFIGPGTVVTATRAGAEFGCQLLWAILLAGFGAMVLQSLVARIAITLQAGLGESIRDSLKDSIWLKPAVALVIAAIGLGNTAYQAGNLTGAATGLASVFPIDPRITLPAIGVLASVLVLAGRYQLLHNILVSLVILLSLAFIVTASFSVPNINRIAAGAFVPRVPSGSLNLVLALIGTTIVPYNLFLHSSAAAKTWNGISQDSAIRQSRHDTVLSIGIGTLVTASICLTASAAFYDRGTTWSSIAETSAQLRPAFGHASGIAFGVGLFAAGLTSSLTAPLATAYAMMGCLGLTTTGKTTDADSTPFRMIAVTVIVIGTCTGIIFGGSPAAVIVFAQVANGLLLPLVAVFLMYVAFRNGSKLHDGIAFAVVLGVACLGIWKLVQIFQSLVESVSS
ncbi:MAG: Nramp family divalent metal transporter [Planctomycetota bacterium]